MDQRMKLLNPKSKRNGVALIVVVGVLVVLAALTTAFFTLTVMQTKSAVRYSDAVRAEMMARAGVEDAIARLKSQAYTKTEDPSDPWYTVDWLNNATKRDSFLAADVNGNTLPYTRAMGASVGPDSDRYTLHITDAASKININACDNLAVVLDNLCRVIGPPLVAADQEALIPMRWKQEGFAFGSNPDDNLSTLDAYYKLDSDSRPITATNDGQGPAKYGDGYAIAGYRARHGRYLSITDVKNALTYVKRNTGNPTVDRQLEQLEREVKFAALREFITVDSWVDTNTICVGKFEWVDASAKTIAIDRDKSWVVDDPVNDPKNTRGSLRGSYLSILNGHGAGQLRRIKTNGIDWIEVENGFAVVPGPISSYMIVAREDAPLVDKNGTTLSNPPPPNTPSFPKTDPNTGTLIDDPDTDYVAHPLCIHRSPVNINTASDKVLEALFLGLNIQYANPMSVGTDADINKLAAWPLKPRTAWNGMSSDWKVADFPDRNQESFLLTPKGLKRICADSGKLVLNRPLPTSDAKFAYINNNGKLSAPNFVQAGGAVNEAHELAYRIIMARQRTQPAGNADPDPTTADAASGFPGYERGPFKSWDDFYFRVVKPWDDIRSYPPGVAVPYSGKPAQTGLGQASVARMIMANFNSNADILKFNPNIEWIDRWGRNFTEMEPLMAYTNDPEPHNNPALAAPITNASIPIFSVDKQFAQWQGSAGNVFLKPFGTTAGSPNAGSYVIRNFRYKSDEMIDKSDLNRSTTEFIFDSAGIYDIESVGQIVNNHEVMAERRVEALVKVYDVWRETTQRQFAQGTLSKAAPTDGTIDSFAHSGSVTRDAVNVKDKLALATLPEPLVPLRYTINNPKNAEVSDRDKQPRDGWGNPKSDATVPDVIANRVQPASYDGQLSLATNTLRYDENNDKDTFLASFNGDTDTDTCKGNGREQAKIPHLPTNDGDKYRVVNTCSLLGLLDDTIIDVDPDLPAGNPHVYRWQSINNALKGLDPNYYWNNVQVRSGDLRPEGVFLGGPGCSGAKATLKYCFGQNKENFEPGKPTGALVTMWVKPAWHWNDHRSHEFFNASNPSNDSIPSSARACYLTKWGNLVYGGDNSTKMPYTSAETDRNNDLNFELEGQVTYGAGFLMDWDILTYLHGGYAHVYPNLLAPQAAPDHVESPQFRIQPFRWHYVGARWRYGQDVPVPQGDPLVAERSVGHWINFLDGTDTENVRIIGKMARPFINTQCYPETPTGTNPDFWFQYNSGRGIPGPHYFDAPCDIGNPGTVGAGYGQSGQDVKWWWADPTGVRNEEKVFSINNINQDDKIWIYRMLPCDGTYAVIDEFKISARERLLQDNPDWANDRAVKEQEMSRYYLPPNPKSTNPGDVNGCPYFTSQTLLQSLQGYNKTASAEEVSIVRVSWTAFTPRFMHEHKTPTFNRVENFTRHDAGQAKYTVQYQGPFDYVRYNDDNDTSTYSVYRPAPPLPPQQAHATKGVEVELLDDTGLAASTVTYTNPDVMNVVGSMSAPVRVRTDKLRYRVRFRYPIDPSVDPAAGDTVDPSKHYLLDTPVFDDISIVYVTRPRILAYRDMSE